MLQNLNNNQQERLVIREIEIENFKSQRGVHKVTDFNNNFTAIVGPNGSGKSNLFDALQFVFGVTKTKLRIEAKDELSTLIHSSSFKTDIQRCRVKVTFKSLIQDSNYRQSQDEIDDDNVQKEVQGSETFTVSRVIDRKANKYRKYNKRLNKYEDHIDDASTQQQNDEVVPLKEIKDLLIKQGVDINTGRFIVLQFEVKNIADMATKNNMEYDKDKPFAAYNKPGLLEYVDEVVGTKKFQPKIMDAQSTAIKAEQSLSKFRTEFEEKNKDLENFSDQFKKVKSLVDMMKRNQQQKNEIHCIKIHHLKNCLNEEKEDQELKLQELNEAIKHKQKVENENKEYKDQKKKLQASLDKANEHSDKLRDNAEDLIRNLKKIVKEKEKKNNDLINKQAEFAQIKVSKDEVQKARYSLEIDYDNHEEEMMEAKEKQEEYETKVKDMIASRKSELDPIQAQIDKIAVDIIPLLNEKNRLDLLVTGDVKDIREKEEKLVELKVSQENSKISQDDCNRNINEKEERIKKLEEEKNRMSERYNISKGEHDKYFRDAEAMQKRIYDLNQEMSMLNNQQEQNKNLKFYDLLMSDIKNKFNNDNFKVYGYYFDLIKVNNMTDFVAVNVILEGFKENILISDSRKSGEIQTYLRQNVMKIVGSEQTDQAKKFKINMMAANNFSQATCRATQVENGCRKIVDMISISPVVPQEFHDLFKSYIASNKYFAPPNMQSDVNNRVKKRAAVQFCNNIVISPGGMTKAQKDGQLPKTNQPKMQTMISANQSSIIDRNEINQQIERLHMQVLQLRTQQNNLPRPQGNLGDMNDELARKNSEINILRGETNSERINLTPIETSQNSQKENQEKSKHDLEYLKFRSKENQVYMADLKKYTKEYEELEVDLKLLNDQQQSKLDKLMMEKQEEQRINQVKMQGDGVKIKEELAKMKDKEKEFTKQHDSLTKITFELSKKVDELEKEREKCEIDTEDIKAKIATCIGEIEEMRVKQQEQEGFSAEQQAALTKANQNMAECKATLQDAKNRVYKIEKDIKQVEKEQNDNKAKQNEVKKEYPLIDSTLEFKVLNIDEAEREIFHQQQQKRKEEVNLKAEEERILQEFEAEIEREQHNVDQEEENPEEPEDQVKKKKRNGRLNRNRVVDEDIRNSMANENRASDQNKSSKKDPEDDDDDEDEEKLPEEVDNSQDTQLPDHDNDMKLKINPLQTKTCFIDQKEEQMENFNDENEMNERIQQLEQLIEENKEFIRKKASDFSILKTQSHKYRMAEGKLKAYVRMKKSQISKDEELFRLRNIRYKLFMEAQNQLDRSIKKIQGELSQGGQCELSLVSENDPQEGGLVYNARPPNKSWNKISNLSGGERTLASLALIFALHDLKPCPFQIMDEIDAALDIKNCTSVANQLKKHSMNSQCIVITLRCDLQEIPQKLIGIRKLNDCTHNVKLTVFGN